MIDLHCHILPGTCDGAQTLEDSLEMAQLAVEDGITAIVATPHHRNGKYTNPPEQVRQTVQELNHELEARQIPLTIFAGQEIRVTPHFIEYLYSNDLLTLSNSPCMLIEFSSASVPKDIEDIIYELGLKGIVPIIAHPERNAELAKHPQRLYELVELGALSQVTSHSINGAFGRKVQSLAFDLIRHHLVHVVASDAHNITSRPFGLREAYERIERKIDVGHADILLNNAQEIFAGNLPEVWEPIQLRRGWLRRMW